MKLDLSCINIINIIQLILIEQKIVSFNIH